ncbi:hypothetical protein J7T55_011906 [Diaporthe amygdali]|uniref:uncharacterized protein n=1 Tax=Phomopsis amygdali TaxID=1214568 RepID=UPI0022FEE53A|nr:uncharacterized protein J7T55_011906 [Diaporthe amygdali]KAJ0123441.1 hypothetical protein J7T55_011906 [Diaporthe amygdali]
MASQIPPLLESYLSLPSETSQIVLTGILGASTNWLTLRYLYSLLRPAAAPRRDDGDAPAGGDEDVKVLLVSFMRDFAFWKEGAGRLGLNLDALAARGKFLFVDGLSRLYLGGDGPAVQSQSTGRGPGQPAQQQQVYLDSPRLTDVARALGAAVERLQAAGGKVVLLLDQPDLFLAAASPGDGVTGTAWREVVLGLREKVHATLLTLSADEPLVSAQTTTLEKEHASFILSLAHEAEAVISLRLLDTGTAKDVSGVVRITGGGGSLDRVIEEHEYLYHVGGDGVVKVFERGQ